MSLKIAVLFFAVATLLQLSHCIPKHRYARQTLNLESIFREILGNMGVRSTAPSTIVTTTLSTTTLPETSTILPFTSSPVGTMFPTFSTNEENPPSGSSFGSYIPSMPNMPNMPSMPNMPDYYPSQLPQSMNPSNYMNSKPGNSNAAGNTASASEPEASIAAKDGSPSSGSSFGNYIPSMPNMPNMPNMPSMPNIPDYYPSQMPQSMNPSSYLNSKPSGSQ